MLINDLLKKLQDIEEQEKELKQQKKDLIKQAKKDHILEVNIMNLAYELQKLSNAKKCNLYFNTINVPKYLNFNLNKTKEFITSNNMGFGFKFIVDSIIYRFTMPIAEIKLINGENFIDNLEFVSQTEVVPKKGIESLIMINIDLSDKNLEKPLLKEAIFKCIENKENQTSI